MLPRVGRGQRARQRDDAARRRQLLPGDLVAAEDRDRAYGRREADLHGLAVSRLDPVRQHLRARCRDGDALALVRADQGAGPARALDDDRDVDPSCPGSSVPLGQIQPLAVVRTGMAEPSSAVARTDMIFVPQPDVCTRASACGAAARRVEGNCVRTYAAAARAPVISSRNTPPTTHGQTRRRFGGISGRGVASSAGGSTVTAIHRTDSRSSPRVSRNRAARACRAGSRACRLPGLPAVREVAGDAASVRLGLGLFLFLRSVCGAKPFREGPDVNAPVIPVPAPHGVLRDGYDTGGFYDEAFELGPGGEVVPRSHYAEVVAQIASMDGKEVRRAAELANRSFLHRGVTFTIYSDDAPAAERILPFDPIPRIVSAADWAVVEAGLRQRITALNRFVHDIYHGQEILHDGVVPRRLVVLGAPLPPRGRRHRRARRPVPARRRQRPDPRRRRPLDGARGQPAHAERRLLRALEPADHDAHVPRLVRRARRALGRLLRGAPARQPRRALAASRRPRLGRRADRRRADAGHLQLGLLRARVPRPADGRRARRGPRPVRARQPRLHAHDARAPPGRRDLPPRRRRVPRPARLPAGVDARGRRAARRGAHGQRHARERDRHGRRRRQGRLPLRARDHPLLPGGGADPRQRADVPADRSRAARVHPRAPRLSSS